jgi:hypothetical protein
MKTKNVISVKPTKAHSYFRMTPAYTHTDAHSPQALWLDSHFLIDQMVRARSVKVFGFNGAAGIWHTETIIESGGWMWGRCVPVHKRTVGGLR